MRASAVKDALIAQIEASAPWAGKLKATDKFRRVEKLNDSSKSRDFALAVKKYPHFVGASIGGIRSPFGPSAVEMSLTLEMAIIYSEDQLDRALDDSEGIVSLIRELPKVAGIIRSNAEPLPDPSGYDSDIKHRLVIYDVTIDYDGRPAP
jgi:hypothetical protein